MDSFGREKIDDHPRIKEQVLESMETYANQRVIEELENTIEMVGCMFSGSIVDELKKGIQSRIKELKQD